MELKYDRSVSSAMRQIKDRHYIQALEGYTGGILLVGVDYDRTETDKPHSCVIEKMETVQMIQEEISEYAELYDL